MAIFFLTENMANFVFSSSKNSDFLFKEGEKKRDMFLSLQNILVPIKLKLTYYN